MVQSIPRLNEEIRQLEAESVSGEEMASDGRLQVEEWPQMDWERRRQTVENVVHRIVVDGDEIAFELQYMPGQLSNNSAVKKICIGIFPPVVKSVQFLFCDLL